MLKRAISQPANLAQLKRALKDRAIYRIIKHYIRDEYSGQIRTVQHSGSTIFYSGLYNQPESDFSKLNGGRGIYTQFGSAKDWIFADCITMQYKGKPIMQLEILEEVAEEPAEEPAEEKQPEPITEHAPKTNRIPRKFYKLYITILKATSANAAGEKATVYRDKYGRLIEEKENGEIYLANLSMLRAAEIVRIDRIETEAPAEALESPTTPAAISDKETPTEEATQPENGTQDAENISEYMSRFLHEYGKQYRALYEAEDDPETAEQANETRRKYCIMFNEYLNGDSTILAEYIRIEQDYITSDREAAAFMLALEAVGNPTSPETITDGQTATAADTEPQTATQEAEKDSETITTESRLTPTESPTAAPQRHDSTTGDQQTTHGRREPQNGTQDATTGTRAATTTPPHAGRTPHDRQTAGATTARGSPKRLTADPKHIKKIIWYFKTSF